MENIIYFFEHFSTLQKLGWIVLWMSIFWILEGAFPLAQLSYKKWVHAKVNLTLLLSTIIINGIFSILAASVFIWSNDNSVGILNLVDLPLWLEVIIGVLLLDFTAQYIIHYLLHKIPFMWKFHMIHHSDTEVDVTTGTRHHPGDYMFREVFALVAIIFGGIPFGIYAVYRVLTVIFTYWGHSNLNMPKALDKALSYVFITPNTHKFHHHFELPWTDTNFGNIFSFWDRIFGTFVYDDPKKIKYGVDTLEDAESNNLMYQLKVPFNPSINSNTKRI